MIELLAIYEAVKHFRHMMEERNFIIFTDHKPITYAFQQKRVKCSPRQFNHLHFNAQFSGDVRHISGQDNVVADTLSRVESVTAPPSYNELAASQDSDDELQTFLRSTTALRLQKQLIPGTTVSIYCDTSKGNPRPYVPAPLQLKVFQSVHELSHPGTKATARLVAQRFVWPGRQKDCRTWARACQAYQCSKVSRHTVTVTSRYLQQFLAHPHRRHGASSNISRLHILPHGGRPFHALARRNSHPRHHYRDRGMHPRYRLDIPLRLPADYHN
jgi:hypothetical protein